MDNKELIAKSKFLSRVLRHRPSTIGLTLDAHGWADVDLLLVQAGQYGFPITLEELGEVVERNDKQRFSFSEDGKLIRANQGHSIPVDLGLKPVTPPEFLYHGTATGFLNAIQRDGLIPRKRIHVHLSQDEQTALSVGKRHGAPIVLVIRAEEMQNDDHLFYLSANHVWLTNHVPVRYIVFPEE